MNDFCECTDLKDKNQRIHELEEKIREYKDEIRDLHQVDISDLKKTICCLKERVEELDCENEYLKLENDQLCDASFANEVDELMKSNDELEKALDDMREENSKLEILKQHLLNHLSNKEAEIVNLKEENEELERKNKSLNELFPPTMINLIFHDDTDEFELFCNDRDISDHVDALMQAERRIKELRGEIKYWKDKYETLDKDSTDGSYIYISIPKGQKVSNFEVHFQEEHTSSITWASSPSPRPYIPPDPAITYASGKGPITYGSGTGGDAK